MALSESKLATDLTQFFGQMRQETEVDDAAAARKLAKLIHGYVSAAQVSSGITVVTSGSASSQAGKTTSLGKLI